MSSAPISSEQGLVVVGKQESSPTFSFNINININTEQQQKKPTTPSQVSRVVTKESLAGVLEHVVVAPETSSSLQQATAAPPSSTIEEDDSSSLFEFSLDNKESELLSLPLTAIELPLTPPPLTEADQDHQGGDSFESCAATLLTPAVSESDAGSANSSAVSTAAAIVAASQPKAPVPAPPISIRAPPIVSIGPAPQLPVVTPKPPVALAAAVAASPKPRKNATTRASSRSNSTKTTKKQQQPHQQRSLLQQRPSRGGSSPAPVVFTAHHHHHHPAHPPAVAPYMTGMDHQPPPQGGTAQQQHAVPTPVTVAAPAATTAPPRTATAIMAGHHPHQQGGQQLPSAQTTTATAVSARKYAPAPSSAGQVPAPPVQYAPMPQPQHQAAAAPRPQPTTTTGRPRASSSASSSAQQQTASNTVSTLHPNGQVENTGRWTAEEHRLFLQGLEQHGKGWKKIATLIKSRTVVQIRTHAQKYFQKLAKARQNGEAPLGAINAGGAAGGNGALGAVPIGTAEGDGLTGIAIPVGADGQPVVTMRTTAVATSALTNGGGGGNMSLGNDATSLAAANGAVNIASPNSSRSGGGRKRRNAPSGGTKRRAIGNVVRSAVREGRNVKRQKIAESKRNGCGKNNVPAAVASAPVAQVPGGVAPQATANGAVQPSEEYQVPNPLPAVSAVLDPYVTSTMGMPPPPAPAPGTAQAAKKKGGQQQRGRQQMVHTATHGTLPMAALEDAVFRLLTPATGAPAPMPGQPLPPAPQPSSAIVDPLAPQQQQGSKIPVAHTQYHPPNAAQQQPPTAAYPQGALPNSSPTGVADMSLLPSWVDAKNPPAWYNDGGDIDTLLDDAECLNWLSDTGDLEETYPPAVAEPAAVVSGSSSTAMSSVEPTPVAGMVHHSVESLSFLVDPPEQHHGEVVAAAAAAHPAPVVEEAHQLPTFLEEAAAAPVAVAPVSHSAATPVAYASATEAVEATAAAEPAIPKIAGVGESDTNLMGFPDLDMGDEQAFVSALLDNSGQSTMSFPKLNSHLDIHATAATATAGGNSQSGVALSSVPEEQGSNDAA